MTTINMHMKFEIEIPKQTWLTSRKPCHLQSPETEKSNMAARRPFWMWHRWKLKFQSKLDLCSGNHVVYRQTDRRTDGRTDKVNPVYPPSNFLGQGYNYHSHSVSTWSLSLIAPLGQWGSKFNSSYTSFSNAMGTIFSTNIEETSHISGFNWPKPISTINVLFHKSTKYEFLIIHNNGRNIADNISNAFLFLEMECLNLVRISNVS